MLNRANKEEQYDNEEKEGNWIEESDIDQNDDFLHEE